MHVGHVFRWRKRAWKGLVRGEEGEKEGNTVILHVFI